MKLDLDFKYKKLIDFLRTELGEIFDLAIVLGSGLGEFSKSVETIKSIETSSLPDYPQSTVEGHKGYIHRAKYKGKNLLLFQGRIHFYEGYPIHEVLLPVFLSKKLNAKHLLLTNAAGGINPDFNPGDLMVINDFIALDVKKFLAPLIGTIELSVRNELLNFPDKDLIELIFQASFNEKIRLRTGTYYLTKGPSYETPSEIRMMASLGADAVGMSTAHEAIFAKYLGMKVLAISLITNFAAGISAVKLSHKEVIETADRAKSYFEKLVKHFIELL